MISLRFVQHYRSYNSGEIAGFHPEQAEALIAAGMAVLNKPPAELLEVNSGPSDVTVQTDPPADPPVGLGGDDSATVADAAPAKKDKAQK